MTPLDLAGWALALFAFALAVAAAGAVTVVFTRFLEEQRANLATHRAKQAQLAAEARAAEQRAELEAADVLERRLALPFGGTRSLGEQLEARMDQAASVIKQIQRNQDVFSRRAGQGERRAGRPVQRAAGHRPAAPRRGGVMSFSDPRGKVHPALERDAEPETWLIAQWAHERDERRILSEDWPHSWTVPAPPYHPTMEWTTPMHPRSTQRRQRTAAYAAQAALYAHGVHPDLVLVDDIAPEDESIGTELHQLMERFARGRES